MTMKYLYQELCYGCKTNYVVNVILITPYVYTEMIDNSSCLFVYYGQLAINSTSKDVYDLYVGIIYITYSKLILMKQDKNTDPKVIALRESGTLNPHPEEVEDELFEGAAFFDKRDALQVKYEMVRRVEREGWPVARAARRFGFSRPSFYRAQAAIRERGLCGLVPERRGPRRAHKLSGQIMTFVEERLAEATRMDDVVALVQERFSIKVHRRSIERRLRGRKKNGQ